MCLLVTKIPSSHLTATALEKLEILYSLFHTASATSKPAATHLPSILSLCLKAHEAIDPAQHHAAGYSQPPITQTELDRLSGKTHLFSDAQGSIAPSPAHIPSSSSSSSHDKAMSGHRSRSTSVTLSDIPHEPPPSIPTTQGTGGTGTPSDSLHPIIVEDLKDFAARNAVPTTTSLSDVPSDSERTTPTGSGGPTSCPRWHEGSLVKFQLITVVLIAYVHVYIYILFSTANAADESASDASTKRL
ncbi:hypothetical protein H1R20_g10040, partial [Candolleomyces eurysporus]